jgi:hypothetical protein
VPFILPGEKMRLEEKIIVGVAAVVLGLGTVKYVKDTWFPSYQPSQVTPPLVSVPQVSPSPVSPLSTYTPPGNVNTFEGVLPCYDVDCESKNVNGSIDKKNPVELNHGNSTAGTSRISKAQRFFNEFVYLLKNHRSWNNYVACQEVKRLSPNDADEAEFIEDILEERFFGGWGIDGMRAVEVKDYGTLIRVQTHAELAQRKDMWHMEYFTARGQVDLICNQDRCTSFRVNKLFEKNCPDYARKVGFK